MKGEGVKRERERGKRKVKERGRRGMSEGRPNTQTNGIVPLF